MQFNPTCVFVLCWLLSAGIALPQDSTVAKRAYANRLKPISNPAPLLADYPEFFEPITEQAHFEAPPLVVDEGADRMFAPGVSRTTLRRHRDAE